MTVLNVIQKFSGASSVGLPYCRMQRDCVTRQLQPFIVVYHRDKR